MTRNGTRCSRRIVPSGFCSSGLPRRFWSLPGDGRAQFSLADGSVRFVTENIRHAVPDALGTLASGEVLVGGAAMATGKTTSVELMHFVGK